jgi:hypothetical protein
MDSVRLAQEIATLRQRIADLESRERLVVGNANPAALGAAAPGIDTEASREDHVHPLPTPGDVGAEPALGNPAADNYILSSNTAGVRLWVPRTSTATPQPLGTAAAGTAGVASDAGHVHAMPTAGEVGAIPDASPPDGSAVWNGDVLEIERGVKISNSAGGPTNALQINSSSSLLNPVIQCVNDGGDVTQFFTFRSGGSAPGISVFQNVNGKAIVVAPPASGPVYVGKLTGTTGAGDLDIRGFVNVSEARTYSVNNVQVVAARRTGWTAATGTATRSTFATSTVTTAQLAERVKALIDDLIAHGLIGS